MAPAPSARLSGLLASRREGPRPAWNDDEMETLRYYLGMHPMGALAVVLSTVLLYSAFALFLSRVGQRMYASPSSLDLAVVTVLGAIVGRAILGQVPTLSGGLLALTTLFVLESVAGRIRRTERIQARQRHRATAVMTQGRIDRAELRKHGLDEAALWAALRQNGVVHPSQVALVVLERGGRFSVMRTADEIHPAVLTGVRRASELRDQLIPKKEEDSPPGP